MTPTPPETSATQQAGISKVTTAAGVTGRLVIDGQVFEDTFQPAFDWCLIKMTSREDSTPADMKAAGIIEIPHVRQQARNKDGIVVKIGPHKYDTDYKATHLPDIKVGDRVYYGAWAGQETPCPEGYLLIKSREISLLLDKDTSITWV